MEDHLDLHRHPELSGAEERTASRVAARLTGAGFETTGGVGGHGVVGLLRNGPGPVVMLRAELDALPVQETTGLPWAGERDGVMHACGHDLHLACLTGTADLLAGAADHWSGTLMVVGQPAEETLSGARALLEDGLYERFATPDVVLAQHAAPLPVGMVAHAHAHGPVLAGSRLLEVVVHGSGGHAAAPHLAVDPLVAAAAIVLRLQTVVSRETAPAEQVVLTVGSLHAGVRGNIVPDRAVLEVSVRAFADAALDRVEAAVWRIAAAECTASRCPRDPSARVLAQSPPTVPDAGAAETVRRAHEQALGERRVALWPASTATEDFPLFGPAGTHLHGAPGVRTAYWMFGCTGPRQWAGTPGDSAAGKMAALPPNHAPDFRTDPRLAVPAGVTALTAAALAFLGPGVTPR